MTAIGGVRNELDRLAELLCGTIGALGDRAPLRLPVRHHLLVGPIDTD